MKENAIENELVSTIKKHDGRCWKWVSPGRDGVPDRICLLPGGVVVFVECKAPGKKLRPKQAKVCDIIAGLGFLVLRIDTPGKVAMLSEYIAVSTGQSMLNTRAARLRHDWVAP